MEPTSVIQCLKTCYSLMEACKYKLYIYSPNNEETIIVNDLNLDDQFDRNDYVQIYKFARAKFNENRDDLGKDEFKVCVDILLNMLDILIFFEERNKVIRPNYLSRISKLHKRKCDLIRQLIGYNSYDEVIDERLKLVHALLDMLEIKLMIFERQNQQLNPRQLQKMAFICSQGLQEADQLIKDIESVGGEKAFKVERAKAVFIQAKLFNKFFTPNRKEQMKYVGKAVQKYEMFLEMCKADEDLGMQLKAEKQKSEETADLLRRQMMMEDCQ